MRIAHLILTHANPAQLARLIGRLQHGNADIFVHIDKKTTIEPFLMVAKAGRVTFIKKRERVYWGGYSIVQATVNGFEEILGTKEQYDYINLLSGQDYPLKNTDRIHEFFSENPGKAFMHTLSVEKEWMEAIPRITKYHLANIHFPGRYKVEKLLNDFMPKRTFPNNMTPVGRSQWFTISRLCVAYIVDYLRTNYAFKRFFKLSWAPDEMIFQTILYNSPFRDIMVNNNLRYIDWSAGKPSPKVLTMQDAPLLENSGKLYARKFDPDVDNDILNHLDRISL